MLKYERELIKQGRKLIAGVDEAGRGPLAGPVVCACVVMPLEPGKIIKGVNDSKLLTAKVREKLYEKIMRTALYVNVAAIDHLKIDEINIYWATMRGMENAVAGLGCKPDFVLVDGKGSLNLESEYRFIVGGDALSYSVAAASIVAKVTRDAMMVEYDKLYPQYKFYSNKGYATPEHIKLLRAFGECAIHRQSFLRHFKEEDVLEG